MFKRRKQNRKLPEPVPFWRRGQVALSVFLSVGVLAGGAWTLSYLTRPDTLPLRSVRLDSTFVKTNEKQLREVVEKQTLAGFFSTDVEAIRAALETLPWVRVASIRRVWPDRLHITVYEQIAVARWGEHALLNADGEVFAPERESFPEDLPRLSGPANSAPDLLARFGDIDTRLTRAGRRLVGLDLNARLAITLRLDNGIELALGRADNEARLARFMSIYQRELAARAENIAYVDMRYTNGGAVHWKPEPEAGKREDEVDV